MPTRYVGNAGAIGDFTTRQSVVRLDEALGEVSDSLGRIFQNNQFQEISVPGEDSTALKLNGHLRLRDDRFLYWAPKGVNEVSLRSAGIRWHVSGVSPDRFDWDVKKNTKMTLDADGRWHLGLTNDPAIYNTNATTSGVMGVVKNNSSADGLVILSNNVTTTAGAVVTFQTASNVAFCQYRGTGNSNEYSYIALGDRQGFTGAGKEWYMLHSKRATPGNNSLEWEYFDGAALYAPMALNASGRLHLGGLTTAGSLGGVTGGLLNIDLDTANLTTTSGIILRRDGSQSADLLQFQLQTGVVSTVCDASFRWHMGGTSAALTDRLKVTGNVNEGGLNIANVTQTTNAGYGLNVAQTWNSSGANFTAVDINVTPTAFSSASLSHLFRLRSSSNAMMTAHPINNSTAAFQFEHIPSSTVTTTDEHKYGAWFSAGDITAKSWNCSGGPQGTNVEPLGIFPRINNTNAAAPGPGVTAFRIDAGGIIGNVGLIRLANVTNFFQGGDMTVNSSAEKSGGIVCSFDTPGGAVSNVTIPLWSSILGQVFWGDSSGFGGSFNGTAWAAVEADLDIGTNDGTLDEAYGLLVTAGEDTGATRGHPVAIGGRSAQGGWLQFSTKNNAAADDADNGVVWSSVIAGTNSSYANRLARIGYDPSSSTLEFELTTTVEMEMSTASLFPTANAGLGLGKNGNGWADLWLKDTAAAFELQIQTTNTSMSADRVLTYDGNNANRSIVLKGDINSGVYSPTLTNVANLDASTTYQAQWVRVGDMVTVSGKVDVDPTLTATATQLGISLPVASNLGAQEDCSGVAFASGITGQGAAIRGDAANDRAEMAWVATDVTNQPMYFQFTYQII